MRIKKKIWTIKYNNGYTDQVNYNIYFLPRIESNKQDIRNIYIYYF